MAALGLSCGTRDLSLAAHRLSSFSIQAYLLRSVSGLSSSTTDGTQVPCAARQILNHWAKKCFRLISCVYLHPYFLPSPAHLAHQDLWGWESSPCFLDGSVVKNLPANAGDAGLIPGLGRSPGGGNGNLLQYSCLGNLMDRGAWWATVHGVSKELDMT